VECGYRQYSTYDDCTECQTCYFGRVFEGRTICAFVDCFGGYTMDRDSNCICQAGYYETTMNFCLQCGEGQYSSAVNSTECLTCFGGFVNSEHTTCLIIDCGEGYTVDKDKNCICKAGSYIAANSKCLRCGEGTYSSNDGSKECLSCHGAVNDVHTQCLPR
jgi:Tyrosine-protein kinase ephrin type A/B receptor-like